MGGRIIALDLGTVRSGLAVSDPTQSIAQPLAVLSSTDTEAFISEIAQYVADYDAERVIVGIPRTMDGRMGEMARWAEAFAANVNDVSPSRSKDGMSACQPCPRNAS